MSPRRIQMTRQTPWRHKHPDAVIVARPSKWGNPIRITRERARNVTWYRVHGSPMDRNGGPAYVGLDTARHFAAKFFEWDLLNGRYGDAYPSLEEIRDSLAGRDLACWCPPRRVYPSGNLGDFCCHADVLLDVANYLEAAQ